VTEEETERLHMWAHQWHFVRGVLIDAGCPIVDGCHIPSVVTDWLDGVTSMRHFVANGTQGILAEDVLRQVGLAAKAGDSSLLECAGIVIRRLRDAIAKHHAQKADDRCQFDDDELYTAAGLPHVDRRVGDKFAMLANCAKFIENRCEAGGPWKSYAEMEAQVQRLRVEIEQLNEASPFDIRACGWALAVHNDYRLNGEPHTFWLFTQAGVCVKGEGCTDAEALNQVREQIGLKMPTRMWETESK
jgi:hypothetical protein